LLVSVQNILSLCLLPKNVKIKVYKTTDFAPLLCRCESLSLTLGEEKKGCLENRLLGNVFRSKRKKVVGGWIKLCNEEFRDCIPCQILG
jgi:hypothetical protein